MYHVSRNGTQQGPHSLEEINQMIASAQLSSSDLAWQEGMSDWTPLHAIPGVTSPPPLPPAMPPGGGAPRGPYSPPRSHIAQPAHSGPASTSGMAVASMVLGILCILLFFTHIFAFIMALLAIIFGHVSRGNIRRARGQLTGSGMALAGLITGYIGMLILVLIFAFAAIFFTTVYNKAKNDPGFRKSVEELNREIERSTAQPPSQ